MGMDIAALVISALAVLFTLLVDALAEGPDHSRPAKVICSFVQRQR
jgi:hypothetical protein